jgi:hypothetical protein
MVGEVFADSAVTHCHARRSSLKTSLTRLSRRPKSQSLYPAGRGVAFYLAFRLTGQPPKSTLASAFRVRTVDVHAIFASLMVVSQLKPRPPTREPLLMYPMSWSRTPKFHRLGIHA